MGGGGQEMPQAPSPGKVARQAINAELKLLPRRVAAEEAFAPRLAQLQADILGRFAPQVAGIQAGLQEQFGGRLARFGRQLQEELFPEEIAAGRQVGQAILGDIEASERGELPAGIQDALLEQFRAGEAFGGRLGGPVGAVNIGRKFADVLLRQRGQALQRGQQFAGRITPQAAPTIGLASPSQAQLGLTGETLGPAFGLAGDVFRTQASLAQQQTSPLGTILGTLGGGLATGLGGGFGTALGGSKFFTG